MLKLCSTVGKKGDILHTKGREFTLLFIYVLFILSVLTLTL